VKRIVFCGSPESAVPGLRAVAGRRPEWEIAAVLTQPDRPRGRGRKLVPGPVRAAAQELGLDTLTPENLKGPEIRETLESIAPDVIVVVAYGHIFRRWLLELPRFGCINLHFSLLPRHRGVAPVQWAILEGDEVTGVTTMKMDRGVDTGPVYLEERVPVEVGDTAGSLTRRLAALGGTLLVETIERVLAGTIEARPQSEDGATYARRLEKEDGRLDWARPAVELARRVRGLSPWPGTFTEFRGERLKILSAGVATGELPPGKLRVAGDRLEVGTGDGLLVLDEVQASGKARTDGVAWVRGARPGTDERLGEAG
jgi:methionyl-tRNA formyltransferase